MCRGTVREAVFYTAGSPFQGWSWIPRGGLHSIIRSLDPTIPRRSSILKPLSLLIALCCFSLSLASPANHRQAQPAAQFTLDQVMSAPFPSDLVAGPGARLAWVTNSKGARNVWLAEPPDYNGRQLTTYTE